MSGEALLKLYGISGQTMSKPYVILWGVPSIDAYIVGNAEGKLALLSAMSDAYAGQLDGEYDRVNVMHVPANTTEWLVPMCRPSSPFFGPDLMGEPRPDMPQEHVLVHRFVAGHYTFQAGYGWKSRTWGAAGEPAKAPT